MRKEFLLEACRDLFFEQIRMCSDITDILIETVSIDIGTNVTLNGYELLEELEFELFSNSLIQEENEESKALEAVYRLLIKIKDEEENGKRLNIFTTIISNGEELSIYDIYNRLEKLLKRKEKK